jgi:hypothetical protein
MGINSYLMRKFSCALLKRWKYHGKKGQAVLLEYIMTVVFSMLVLVAMTAMVRTFYENAMKANIQQSIDQLASQVSNEIVKYYQFAKEIKTQPKVNSSSLLYETTLKLPSTISNRNYEIVLATSNPFWISITTSNLSSVSMLPIIRTSGAKVIVRTTQDPIVSVEKDIPNIEMDVEGSVQNGVGAVLRYYKFSTWNATYNMIVLGDYGILTKITSIT